ncbi:MAG: hypothetical protein LBC70_00765 [Chitinispirillales bacterium]|jgi:hypothetical protein|nr:hypothetical protein [Chitinispirillales bacterium]
MRNEPFVCPNCGELLPPKAKVCRGCGSDENTGWSESTYLDGISLPFEDDEYEEIRAKEFSGGKISGGGGKVRVDWKMAVGAVVVAAMIMAFVCR